MPSPLDPMNPADPTAITSFLDTPEIRRQRMFDTLGGISAAILRASAPSMTPMDIGSIAAAGLAGGAASGQGAEDRFLKRAMVGSQVATAQAELANQKAWGDMFKGPAAGALPGGPATEAALPPTMAPDGSGPNPNNVGNVRPNGQSVGFQQPQTFEDGVKLAVNNVKAYPAAFNNGQPMTLVQIGERWAPKGDGKNDPRQWALNVAQIGGLDPNKPLDFNDPNTAAAFARGVHGAEWGQAALKPPQAYSGALTMVPGMPIGDQPPRADGSGNPIQPVQYQPPQAANVPRPQSMQDVINTMPPGVRQMVGAMGRKDGMAVVMKYADPGSEAVLDTQTGGVVFIPKTMVGRDPRFQPVEGAKLDMDRERLAMDRDKAKRDAANTKVIVDPDGAQRPNETMIAYEQRLKAMEDEFKKAEEKRKAEGGKSEKDFTQEKAIRNEYETQPAVKAYRTVVPMLESAKDAATRPTRAADLNLVYAFAKLMDPDSVVRESETAGVVATASVADRLGAYIGQLNGQAMLSPDTRAKLLDELNSRFQSLKESNDVLASQYTDIATAYGLDPSRVVIPIRAPGRGPGGQTNNQPSQEELKGWATNPNPGGVRLQFVPGKGVTPR